MLATHFEGKSPTTRFLAGAAAGSTATVLTHVDCFHICESLVPHTTCFRFIIARDSCMVHCTWFLYDTLPVDPVVPVRYVARAFCLGDGTRPTSPLKDVPWVLVGGVGGVEKQHIPTCSYPMDLLRARMAAHWGKCGVRCAVCGVRCAVRSVQCALCCVWRAVCVYLIEVLS
jgi:hypothetical protein